MCATSAARLPQRPVGALGGAAGGAGGAAGPDRAAVCMDSLRNLSIQPEISVRTCAAAVKNAAAETTRAAIWLALMPGR